MQIRKEELTAALIDYLLTHGLSELSLRPLAAELGTSARLLIYHFDSKEGLLAAAMDAMHTHLRHSLQALAEAEAPKGIKPLRRFWDWAIAAENLPYMKLLYELQMLAVRNPETYGPFLQNSAAGWLALVKRIMPDDERDAAMTSLPIAVFDGLFLELMSTGDRRRTTRALDRFIELVEQARLHRAQAVRKPRKAATRKRGA
ncbi:TetR/AcrR family transcriptional regulator [Dyella nitratireducens]|uniref:TetR family transcriptional regulator n=1 Tax=Dyella nitratireducens TaxID=1849580 RepID=A0ABQ1FWI3_9GAMM|nr:TetR/AcrR family transcriptional regulator [Dyella nitratireducens]GGA32321.1 TetR family transcriptional regulator [Dyella nitratireducens]GLQ42760.1 TetR family transcriptional regulator [Dyella nitratireducens]